MRIPTSPLCMVDDLDDLLLGIADMGDSYFCGGAAVWARRPALVSGSGAIQTGLVYTVFTYEPYPNPPLLLT